MQCGQLYSTIHRHGRSMGAGGMGCTAIPSFCRNTPVARSGFDVVDNGYHVRFVLLVCTSSAVVVLAESSELDGVDGRRHGDCGIDLSALLEVRHQHDGACDAHREPQQRCCQTQRRAA